MITIDILMSIGFPAMFCTGYTSDQLISQLLQEEHLRAVRKPFRADEFLAAVRECLDTPRL